MMGLIRPWKKFVRNRSIFMVSKCPSWVGKGLKTLSKCNLCGESYVGHKIPGEKRPFRYSLVIDSAEDMSVRVIRSKHSTVRILELGVTITPGPSSEGYISNVEGVLNRIKDVLIMFPNSEKSSVLRKKIEMAMNGREILHLEIEDPTGNSAILSKKASIEGR